MLSSKSHPIPKRTHLRFKRNICMLFLTKWTSPTSQEYLWVQTLLLIGNRDKIKRVQRQFTCQTKLSYLPYPKTKQQFYKGLLSTKKVPLYAQMSPLFRNSKVFLPTWQSNSFWCCLRDLAFLTFRYQSKFLSQDHRFKGLSTFGPLLHYT